MFKGDHSIQDIINGWGGAYIWLKRNEIDDLYAFFTQPWMGALYIEVFDDLMHDINKQELGTVYDLVKSRFDLVGCKSDVKMTPKVSHGFTDNISQCGFGPEDAPNLGTFKSVIQKYFTKSSSFWSAMKCHVKPSDIPSECGQSPAHREEAAAFWETLRGDRVVNAHLDRYLHLYRISNPQYFLPKNAYTYSDLDGT